SHVLGRSIDGNRVLVDSYAQSRTCRAVHETCDDTLALDAGLRLRRGWPQRERGDGDRSVAESRARDGDSQSWLDVRARASLVARLRGQLKRVGADHEVERRTCGAGGQRRDDSLAG